MTPDQWSFIKSTYEDSFLGTTVKSMLDHGDIDGSLWADQIGTNLEAVLNQEYSPFLKILPILHLQLPKNWERSRAELKKNTTMHFLEFLLAS